MVLSVIKTILGFHVEVARITLCFLMYPPGMPDNMNFSDVKQVHGADHGSTLDITGAGCAWGTESMVLTLMEMLVILGLW